MGGLPLHVLGIQEVYSSLGNQPQFGNLGFQLVVLLEDVGLAGLAVLEQDLVNPLTALVHVLPVVLHCACIEYED